MANEDVKTNRERMGELSHCISLLQSIKSTCARESKSIERNMRDENVSIGPMYETAQDIFDALKSIGATVVENLNALSYQYQVEFGMGDGGIDSVIFSQGISAIQAAGSAGNTANAMTGFNAGDYVRVSGATSSLNNAVFTVISTNANALYTATPMADSTDTNSNLLFKLVNRTI